MTRLLRAWWGGLRVAFAPPGAVKVERSIVFALAGIVLAVAVPWLRERGWEWAIALVVLLELLAIGALFAPLAAEPAPAPPRDPPGP